ncbi:hypothetical protein [Saccharicrinis fermentans]|uniref:Uncharacterized protein n=1 Tax=Saccharicrinis fermentans DSM 9555 = JCM 21142 TaxID=869213 RepID=W7YAS2_9BACT|nr:hypothetical protein [Saccharicrinis fermentans]GAF05482.1 hypothetical protein JCM21142_104217 [Saccharicrinis fermentans DSM 9555 = JCM 21142]
MVSSILKFKLSFKLFVTIILVANIALVKGQSIIEDERGFSTLGLTPGFKETKKGSTEDKPKIDTVSFDLGMVKFTTKDKKLALDYYSYFTPQRFTDYYIGISTNSKIKNSTANIFSEKNIVAEGEVKLKTGFRIFKNKTDWPKLMANRNISDPDIVHSILNDSTKPANDLWLVLEGSFSGTSFKRFLSDTLFSSQIQKENFTGYNVQLGLNYWNARILNLTTLTGISLGVKQKNNFDDLVEGTREDTKVSADTLNMTTRKYVIKETVYSGDYETKTVYPLNFDLYVVPHNLKNIGFLGYSRTEISSSEKPKTTLGLGVFFLKNQNAFNPTAGMTFSFKDAFNVDKSDDNKGGINKFTISLTTRINLVNSQKRN